MGRSPGFGSTISNLNAHLRLAFAMAPDLKSLTLLRIVTRWPVLQKVRGHTKNVLPQLVSVGFQVLFHSPSGVLFTFPSRYYALSVTKKYLALGGGPPCFPQGFTCPVVLWIMLESLLVSPTGLLPSMVGLSRPLQLRYLFLNKHIRNPYMENHIGLGSSHFARRYSGNRIFFLLLGVLRCFSSPGSLP